MTVSAPASPGQVRLWAANELDPLAGVAYGLCFRLDFRSEIDPMRMQSALDSVVDRHESLRTRLVADGAGRLLQQVDDSVRTELSIVECDDGEQADLRIRQIERVVSEAPWRLSSGPALRAALVRRAGHGSRLILAVHHVAADGYSAQLLTRQIVQSYISGSEPDDDQLQFVDYSAWYAGDSGDASSDQAVQDIKLSHARFWRTYFQDHDGSLALPYDGPRGPFSVFRGDRCGVVLDSTLQDQVNALATELRTSRTCVYLAAWQLLMSIVTGSDDVIVATPVANRLRAELQDVVGFLANVVPLRTRLDGADTVKSFIVRCHQEIGRVVVRSMIPFDQIQECAAHGTESAPLMQSFFSMNSDVVVQAPAETSVSGEIEGFSEIGTGTAKFDIGLYVTSGLNGILSAYIEFRTNLLTREAVLTWTALYTALLYQIVADSSVTLDRIHPQQLSGSVPPELNTDIGVHSPVRDGDRFAEYEPPLSALIRSLDDDPDRTVAVAKAQPWTGRRLHEAIFAAAAGMRSLGVGSGEFVYFTEQATVDSLAAMFACWSIGAIYVPITINGPIERRRRMYEQCEPRLFVGAGDPMAQAISVDAKGLQSTGGAGRPARTVTIDRSAPAYLMFTSGTTGTPKPVLVSHGNLAYLIDAVVHELKFDASTCWLSATDWTFDISLLEIIAPLVVGGRLVLADPESRRDPWRLAELISENSINTFQATPSSWRLLCDAGVTLGPGFTALCGGEYLDSPLARRLCSDVLQDRGQLWNMYGPTETTIWSLFSRIEDPHRVTIGSAFPGTFITVLDSLDRPVPPGSRGELCIGGKGVSLGYYGNSTETARRFLPDESAAGERTYRTGDVVRIDLDGSLIFVGRRDGQVKVRGVRIELGEIETAVRHSPLVSAASAFIDGPVDNPVVSCVCVKVGEGCSDEDLRASALEQAQARLPSAAIPQRFLVANEIPLLASGKLDKRRLLETASVLEAGPRERIPARTQTEITVLQIWREILPQQDISVDDNFFSLGGNSVLTAHLLSRLELALGSRPSVADFFVNPTVAAVSARYDSLSELEADSGDEKLLLYVDDWDFE